MLNTLWNWKLNNCFSRNLLDRFRFVCKSQKRNKNSKERNEREKKTQKSKHQTKEQQEQRNIFVQTQADPNIHIHFCG